MDGNFFFVIAIVLVVSAVGISFIGIRRSDSFPPSRAVLLGVIALFVAVVGTSRTSGTTSWPRSREPPRPRRAAR
jgi:protein-S-isoprenylcysteine O-methyltransferase Ste14